MSEIPETPTGAARSLIGWFAGGLAFQSIENLHVSLAAFIGYGMGAIGVAIIDFKLPSLLVKSPLLTKSLNRVAADARWWLVAIFFTIFMVTLSPFIEQHRWPFASLQQSQSAAATLLPVSSAELGKDLHSQIQALQSQLGATQDQLAETKNDLVKAQQQQNTSPLANTGPIQWDLNGQLLVVSGNQNGVTINSIMFQGTSLTPVSMKEAYLVSGLTGRREDLQANVHDDKGEGSYHTVNKINIPAQAPVLLELPFNPPVLPRDFLDQWRKFSITVVYSDGTTYRHEYEENFVKQYIERAIPYIFGPHVTPKEP